VVLVAATAAVTAAAIAAASGTMGATTARAASQPAAPRGTTSVSAALTPAELAQAAYDRMTPAQRIGQLFMVGGSVTGLGSATGSAISTYHVGNLMLTARTASGAAPVRAVTSGADRLTTSAATSGVPLFIATDQEGGYVQVLKGPGFSAMPTALTQGGWAGPTLTSQASAWGYQVFRAGVDVDLAPVLDTVPAALGAGNPPIGHYYREYGYTPAVVADKGYAFYRGMQFSGLAMTAKHFPGLGHVTANTDTTAGVRDTVTTRTSPDITPFRLAVSGGMPFLMVSSAIYTQIDASQPALFSSTVVTGMVRGDLGFNGIVITDDVGSARQVAGWSPGSRAVYFLAAGGDVVLTVDPTIIPSMIGVVTVRAAGDPALQAKINVAALRVLTVKATFGLLGGRLPTDGVFLRPTVRSLQRWLGVAQTGLLDQVSVRALQGRIGTTADGQWGAASMAAMQSYLGATRDGARTWNARTVALLQAYLNTQL